MGTSSPTCPELNLNSGVEEAGLRDLWHFRPLQQACPLEGIGMGARRPGTLKPWHGSTPPPAVLSPPLEPALPPGSLAPEPALWLPLL